MEKSREEILKMDFNDAYDYLQNNDNDLYWDDLNSEDTLFMFINEKMREGITVSHILKVIEDNPSEHGQYSIWLGNSTETPKPINTVEELLICVGWK